MGDVTGPVEAPPPPSAAPERQAARAGPGLITRQKARHEAHHGDQPVLGVVCGLQSEAAALGAWRRDARIAVEITGARAGAAAAAAERLAARGVSAFVSFGLAGGLDPSLRPGDALRPIAVTNSLGASIPVAAPLEGVAIARLASADRIIDTPKAKAALAAETGAAAVDMESWEVASVAARRRAPLLVLRAVADPADRALPPAALTATRPDGGVALGAVLGALARSPGQLPDLVRLGRDAASGTETLKRLIAEGALKAFLIAHAPH
ncbi:MAG: hypothetical protein AAF909_02900 [Pseudomonadota bacterium]